MQNSPDSESAKAVDRGLAWLMKQQAADGGWHSQTYGQLKGGAAVTALILDSLSQLPVELLNKQAAAIDRAMRFLETGLLKRRTIAAPDGSLDFPTYGCALLLTAMSRLQLKIDFKPKHGGLLQNYLLGAQLLEPRGFALDHASYGGWDFLGAGDAHGITTGTNVSVVAHVLLALVVDDAAVSKKAHAAAKNWLLRCQQADGGFAFTPEPASLNNKAEYADEARTKPRSYGTATCDGIQGLLAVGVAVDEEPVLNALAWLNKRPALEVVPGFEDLPLETEWRRGLRLYYYYSLARLLPLFPAADRISRTIDIRRILLKDQLPGGEWQNESDRMRENDPLIATAFAVSTLVQLQ